MKRSVVFVTTALLLGLAVPAGAETRYPTVAAKRPLTLERGLVRANGDFGIARFPVVFGSETATALLLGVDVGVTDDVELGATVLPLELSPNFEVANPELRGTYRLISGSTDFGLRVQLILPVQDGLEFLGSTVVDVGDQRFVSSSDFTAVFGAPTRFFLSDTLRFDMVPSLAFSFEDPTIATLFVPLDLTFNPIDQIFISARLGLQLRKFDFDDGLFIPIGFGVTYTVLGSGSLPLVDVGARFEVPWFINNDQGGDFDLFIVSFSGRLFFDAF